MAASAACIHRRYKLDVAFSGSLVPTHSNRRHGSSLVEVAWLAGMVAADWLFWPAELVVEGLLP